jgi:hypothetical protein
VSPSHPRSRKTGSASRPIIHRPGSRGQPHPFQFLQPADGETARLRIALARIVQPQVDVADSSAPIRIALSRRVQRSVSTSLASAERISAQPASAGRG